MSPAPLGRATRSPSSAAGPGRSRPAAVPFERVLVPGIGTGLKRTKRLQSAVSPIRRRTCPPVASCQARGHAPVSRCGSPLESRRTLAFGDRDQPTGLDLDLRWQLALGKGASLFVLVLGKEVERRDMAAGDLRQCRLAVHPAGLVVGD